MLGKKPQMCCRGMLKTIRQLSKQNQLFKESEIREWKSRSWDETPDYDGDYDTDDKYPSVPSGNTPLPETMLTQTYVDKRSH